MAGTNGAGARAPMSSSGFCGFATLSGGPYLRWQRRARGAVLDNGKACALAMPGVQGAHQSSCAAQPHEATASVALPWRRIKANLSMARHRPLETLRERRRQFLP